MSINSERWINESTDWKLKTIKEVLEKIGGGERRKMSKAKKEKEDIHLKIWKLILIAVVIPMLSAVGYALNDYMLHGVWIWTGIVAVITATTIPTIINWLREHFNLEKELIVKEKDEQISGLKDIYEAEIKQLKDENRAFKIKAGLYEFALDKNDITKPDVDKYTN